MSNVTLMTKILHILNRLVRKARYTPFDLTILSDCTVKTAQLYRRSYELTGRHMYMNLYFVNTPKYDTGEKHNVGQRLKNKKTASL